MPAKDKATGKDQFMTIALSSGLSDNEIECITIDAEQHAEQDKACRDIIEEANKAIEDSEGAQATPL